MQIGGQYTATLFELNSHTTITDKYFLDDLKHENFSNFGERRFGRKSNKEYFSVVSTVVSNHLKPRHHMKLTR